MILAGRGFGKTRSGSEWVREKWKNGAGRIALVAETSGDARDVMIEGKSGILAVHPKDERPHYEPSKRRLTWPNGSVATVYNATEPDQLRGPEHDTAWCDELAKYAYAQDLWDNLTFGMRLSVNPQTCVTTTPRPTPIVRSILRDPTTIVTRGSTFDNISNLPASFVVKIKAKYEGTRLGRQELYAEVLDDVPGALWNRGSFKNGVAPVSMRRIVVAVDPSGASGDEEGNANSIGIIVVGQDTAGGYWVLEDSTCNLGPSGWSRLAVQRYKAWGADMIVAERNFGGAMVESTIRTADDKAKVKLVTASRGKVVRAEPIASLYEQKRVTHVNGLDLLEDQMMQMTNKGFLGDGSPDRVDAAVWGLSEVALDDITTVRHEELVL